jgi:transposase
MGLSRRQFTREFKLAAVQRLEAGSSVAEVARVFGPSLSQSWRSIKLSKREIMFWEALA